MYNNFFKKSLIVALSLFLIVALAVFYFKQKSGGGDDKLVNEATDLKDSNNEIVAKAEAVGLKELRKIDDTDYAWGEAKAPVEIIVYSNFSSPFSLQLTDTLSQVKKQFSGKVKIAFRHYSLGMFPDEIQTANASECAGEQGKFWEMIDALFADNKVNNLNPEQYQKDAQTLDLDGVKFTECLQSVKYQSKIEAQIKEGKSFGVNGVPTVFVNNKILPGAYPFADFTDSSGAKQSGLKSIIEKELIGGKS